MISHKHHGPHILIDHILPTDSIARLLHTPRDPKHHARNKPHAPLEAASDRPLYETVVPERSQYYTRDDAVDCAAEHEVECCYAEGGEGDDLRGARGQDERYKAEEHGYRYWGGYCVEEPTHRAVVVLQQLGGCEEELLLGYWVRGMRFVVGGGR